MADSGISRPRNKTAMAFAVGLTALCGVLFLTMANGAIFRATNGSSMGLVMGMAGIWLSGIGAFAAWWVALDPLHRKRVPKRPPATIHRFEVPGTTDESAKSRDIA